MLKSSNISVKKIKTFINDNTFISQIYIFKKIDSTNLEAKRMVIQGLRENSMLISEVQTKGRGRFINRAWISKKKKDILMSILLFPTIKNEIITQLSPIIAVSICKVIREQYGCEAFIKWPNDIVINNKKVCGILTESFIGNNNLTYVILGIGLNVNTKKFPDQIRKKATSLFIETKRKFDRSKLVADILNQFQKDYSNYLQRKQNDIFKQYSQLCITIGKKIEFTKDNRKITAMASDISDSFSLIAKANENTYQINSGEVVIQNIY